MMFLTDEQLEYILETSDLSSKQEIVKLLNQIIDVDASELNELIKIQYISNLNDVSFYKLFEYCLLACRLMELTKHIKALIDLFTLEIETALNVIHQPSAFTKYLIKSDANEDLINYVLETEVQTLEETWFQLANWVEIANIQIAMKFLIPKSQNLSQQTIKEIIHIANNYNNYSFKEYFLSHFHSNIAQINKPVYVRDLGLKNLDLSEHIKQLPVPKLSELQLTASDDLMISLEEFPLDEYSYIVAQQLDPDLMKVLGPLNYNPNSTDPNCSYYGGCRYLLCTCHENILYEDTREADWFYGYCTNCGNQIPNRQSAIREAISGGGYKGCFCSLKCMVIQLYNMEHQESFTFDDLHPLEASGYERSTIIASITPNIYKKVKYLNDEELYYFSTMSILQQILMSATLENLYKFNLQDDYELLKSQREELELADENVYHDLMVRYLGN